MSITASTQAQHERQSRRDTGGRYSSYRRPEDRAFAAPATDPAVTDGWGARADQIHTLLCSHGITDDQFADTADHGARIPAIAGIAQAMAELDSTGFPMRHTAMSNSTYPGFSGGQAFSITGHHGDDNVTLTTSWRPTMSDFSAFVPAAGDDTFDGMITKVAARHQQLVRQATMLGLASGPGNDTAGGSVFTAPTMSDSARLAGALEGRLDHDNPSWDVAQGFPSQASEHFLDNVSDLTYEMVGDPTFDGFHPVLTAPHTGPDGAAMAEFHLPTCTVDGDTVILAATVKVSDLTTDPDATGLESLHLAHVQVAERQQALVAVAYRLGLRPSDLGI